MKREEGWDGTWREERGGGACKKNRTGTRFQKPSEKMETRAKKKRKNVRKAFYFPLVQLLTLLKKQIWEIALYKCR